MVASQLIPKIMRSSSTPPSIVPPFELKNEIITLIKESTTSLTFPLDPMTAENDDLNSKFIDSPSETRATISRDSSFFVFASSNFAVNHPAKFQQLSGVPLTTEQSKIPSSNLLTSAG